MLIEFLKANKMKKKDTVLYLGDTIIGFMINGEYVNTLERTWERISDQKRSDEWDKLKCDEHPDADFKKWDKSGEIGWYREYPTVFYCKGCEDEGFGHKTTEWHYCFVCGMVKGTPRWVKYKSPPSSWANLAGREGTNIHCLKCTAVIGYSYHIVS